MPENQSSAELVQVTKLEGRADVLRVRLEGTEIQKNKLESDVNLAVSQLNQKLQALPSDKAGDELAAALKGSLNERLSKYENDTNMTDAALLTSLQSLVGNPKSALVEMAQAAAAQADGKSLTDMARDGQGLTDKKNAYIRAAGGQ